MKRLISAPSLFKYFSQTPVSALLCLLGFCSPLYAARYDVHQLDRLFTNSTTRSQLDQLRAKALNPQQHTPPQVAAPEENKTPGQNNVVLHGIVFREDKNNVAWVNESSTLKNKKINAHTLVLPDEYNYPQRSVGIQSHNKSFHIRPGQIWLEDQATTHELYFHNATNESIEGVLTKPVHE